MRPRVKKLIGAAVLIVGVAIYALVVMAVGEARFREAGDLARLAYFAFFGLIWVIPAGLLIGWMERVGRDEGGR